MDNFFTQASDSFGQVETQLEGVLTSGPGGQMNVMSDEEIKRRNRVRVLLFGLILTAILGIIIWRKYKK